jgi:hypothetical protein
MTVRCVISSPPFCYSMVEKKSKSTVMYCTVLYCTTKYSSEWTR